MLNATPFGAKVLHDRFEREGNPLLRRRHPRHPAQALCPLGLLAGVAAVVMLHEFNSANAPMVRAICLSPFWRRFSAASIPSRIRQVGGLMLALIILQVISSAFNLLNLSQFLTLAIWVRILIAVAAVPHLRGRAGRKQR